MNVPASYQASASATHPKNVITKKNRRVQLAKLSLIAFVSIATVALTIVDVIQTAKSLDKKIELKDKIQASIDTAMLIHSLQKERGMTALRSTERLGNSSDSRKLLEFRRESDQAIVKLKKTNEAYLDRLADGSEPFANVLKGTRRSIDTRGTTTVNILQKYREWIIQLIYTITEKLRSENLEGYANLVYAYELLIMSKEEAGLERALGGLKFLEGKNFSHENTTWYMQKSTLAKYYLEAGFQFSNEMKNIKSSVFANSSDLMKKIESKREVLYSASHAEPSNEEGLEWFDLMTKYNNLLLQLQIRQADLINVKVDEAVEENTNQLIIRSVLLCFSLIVVPCIIISLGMVQKRFYEYTLSLFDKVGLEQARTDFLMRENARHIENLAGKWKDFSRSIQSHNTRSGKTVAPNTDAANGIH